MSNRLSVDKPQGITQLFVSGMSHRQTARAIGIDKKSETVHQPKMTVGALKGATYGRF
jgi:hypothetical protein